MRRRPLGPEEAIDLAVALVLETALSPEDVLALQVEHFVLQGAFSPFVWLPGCVPDVVRKFALPLRVTLALIGLKLPASGRLFAVVPDPLLHRWVHQAFEARQARDITSTRARWVAARFEARARARRTIGVLEPEHAKEGA